MRFYDIDGDREVALEQVAAELRPLLVQAAPMFAPAVDTPTRADLLAAVAAYQQEVATLRSDLTRIEAANADLFHTMEQATRQRDEADAAESVLNAELARLRQELHETRQQLADMTADRNEWREERNRFATRCARVRTALDEGIERD